MQIWIILLIFALSSGSVAFAQEIGEGGRLLETG